MLSCFGLSGALAGFVGGGGGLICSETGFWFGLHLPISAAHRWITGATWSCQLAYRLGAFWVATGSKGEEVYAL